eukprot:6121357-Prymnesium_polylepis.1
MLTCVRTGFDGRTVPPAEGTLESSPAVVRSVKETSTRDQGEQPDGRVHRRTQCRKRQRVSEAPRFNGYVLPASVERPRHDSPAELYGPSR